MPKPLVIVESPAKAKTIAGFLGRDCGGEAAVDDWRDLDRRLVDAQEARRILDRLYGYEVSPVLWKKVLPKLSAGRVQSVATRILVERERARIRFRSASWWDLEGRFSRDAQP